jgi:HEAT repeats
LLYLPYAQAASERFRSADELAGFFGLFWAAGTGAAFLVSMLITNRLLVWFGVGAMVIVLPLLYTTAFGVLLVEQGFVTLVALRFAVGTWLQGVASPGWEALFNVVPESQRDQTRAFMNGGPVQIGTVMAGVIALVGQEVLSLRQLAAIGLTGALLTIIATIGIRRSYAGALVDALRAGRPQVFERPPVRQSSVALEVDADSMRVLAESTRSSDVRVRRLAFQLLAEARPSEVLGGIEDDDPIVRMAVIRTLDLSTPRALNACMSMIDDPDPAVAAAAAAWAIGVTDDARPMSRLQALLADPDDGVRRAAVEQLALAPADSAEGLAWELLADPDAEIRAAALERVIAAAPDRGLEPALADLGL